MRKQQSGVMLLEALIAILIFSLGILGIVGMQASAMSASRDAKYRTDAGLLANEIIGQMWAADRQGDQFRDAFQGDIDDALPGSVVADGPRFLLWRARVRATLPGGDAEDPRVDPLVTVVPGPVNPAQTVVEPHTVTVVVRWKGPNDDLVHSYTVTTRIAQTS